jgi:hypothetical protein
MKNSSDLPGRRAESQPTAPPRALVVVAILVVAGSRSNFAFKNTDATVITVGTNSFM